MKVVIAGGSGQVGSLLARDFFGRGADVIVLSRRPGPGPWRMVAWDGETLGPWQHEINGADVVINLAGRSVNCRYTAPHRREILASRITSTHAIGEAIARAVRPPRVWLQASTATIYAHRFDAPNDERTGILGGSEATAPAAWRFSIEVAQAWERAFHEAAVPRTRKIAMRSALTLSPDPGGVFDTLLGLVRHGLGGTAGDGRQYVSWIHADDFLAATHFLIERDDLAGAVNLAAPNPLPNADFMRLLRRAWGTPIGLPSSSLMLEAGAFVMGTETELILKSRRVVPQRLMESGFRFTFGEWDAAARDLCDRWRALRAGRSESSSRESNLMARA